MIKTIINVYFFRLKLKRYKEGKEGRKCAKQIDKHKYVEKCGKV